MNRNEWGDMFARKYRRSSQGQEVLKTNKGTWNVKIGDKNKLSTQSQTKNFRTIRLRLTDIKKINRICDLLL